MPQKKNISKQTKVAAEKNGDKPRNAYFLSLELENVRCFGEKQKIDFSDSNDEPRQWTIILGDNGTGKTTLLQYLAKMLPLFYEVPDTEGRLHKLVQPKDVEFSKDFSIKDWLNRMRLPVKHILDINLVVSLQHSLEKKFPKSSLSYGSNGSNFDEDFTEFKVNFFAYGASRKAGKTSLSEQNEESSYITLFDETALLINPEEWFLQADYASKRESEFPEKRNQQLETVIEILKKILPDVDHIRIRDREFNKEGTLYRRIPQPIVEFHTPYGWIESKDLSLGYRTSMAWTVDFASKMFDRYPESKKPLAEPAVVLIDEIDLHLHPKWQRELIDYLTNLFPNTQFIVTTHSPLIVQAAAARDANIVVCRREGDHVVIDQSVEAVTNWRADQILTSELFDLPTARPKEIEPFLEERQRILSKAKLTKKDEKRLQELEEKIGSLPVSENPEDDTAMDIIRRAAEHLQSQAR